MPGYLTGDDLLGIFVAADRALGDGKRERSRVALQRTGALVRHRGFARLAQGANAWMRCDRQDIEDLAAARYLRLDKSTGRDGRSGEPHG